MSPLDFMTKHSGFRDETQWISRRNAVDFATKRSGLCESASISFASASISEMFFSVIAIFIETLPSANVRFLQPSVSPLSNRARIAFAAIGAQLPFSTKPIFLF